MALQMMMKIDGLVGETKSFKHKGWADVLSWSWGMTSNRKQSEVTEGDKTSLNELSIVKAIGSDSSGIRMLYAKGATISTVEICIFPAVGKREAVTDYVDIKLEGALIKSIVTGGGVDDAFFREHITFLFDKVKFEYTDESAAKNEDGTKVEIDNFEWNVSENAEWKEAGQAVLQDVK